MDYQTFTKKLNTTGREIYREVFRENQENIRIKKEKTAVKNFEKIFDAVFRITYEKGFQAMSMRDLSQEAGMSLGSLYAYFTSKEELLAIIQRQGATMIKRVLEEADQESAHPLARLRAVIRVHLFLSEAARPWFYFTFMEARNLASQELNSVIAMEEYTENILVHILEAGETTGVFKPDNHQLTAGIIKAMQQDWYLKRWKYTKRKISVDQYADHLLAMVESFCLI